MLKKFTFAIMLFLAETVLQVLYLSIETKYFTEFHSYDYFSDILYWQVYYVGSLKLLLCLPVYLIFYGIYNTSQTSVRGAFKHGVVFWVTFMLSFVISLPFSGGLLDFFLLPVISFLSALIMLSIFKKWMSLKLEKKKNDSVFAP